MPDDGRARPTRDELASLASTLFPAVVGDVMDTLGLQHQFLPPRIKPLDEGMVVMGRAMPVVEADIDPDEPPPPADDPGGRPFGLMFRALDDLRPGEVYVAGGASPTYALWGGLMSNRAVTLQAAGAVLDGYSRDTAEIRALGFPTFSYGGYAQDQRPRGRVVDFRVPVTIGGVRVEPGDVVFGDLDGVCVIPAEHASDVLHIATERVTTEDLVRTHIRAGNSSAEAFERFGVM